jgi:hypothetical protein
VGELERDLTGGGEARRAPAAGGDRVGRRAERRRRAPGRPGVGVQSGPMATLARGLLVATLLAGCATRPPAEEMAAGCPAHPAEPLILPDEQAVFVATGPEDRSVTTAHVTGTDLRGTLTVESDRGPVEVWIVDTSHYHFGDRVEISMAVRAVRVEVRPASPASPETPPAEWSEPGDHAVVRGRILSADPRGTIAVESPRGPVRVWATIEPGRYCVKNWVEVQSRVRRAP